MKNGHWDIASQQVRGWKWLKSEDINNGRIHPRYGKEGNVKLLCWRGRVRGLGYHVKWEKLK